MAKRTPKNPSGQPPAPSSQSLSPGEKPDAAKQEQERRNFIEAMAGYGMPLAELGLLLVPQLSEAEIKLRYADLVEVGIAKAKAKSVNWIWESAEKGNVTARIYLTKVIAGWTEKGGVGEPKTEAPETPAQGQSLTPEMPNQDKLNKSFPFLVPNSRTS